MPIVGVVFIDFIKAKIVLSRILAWPDAHSSHSSRPPASVVMLTRRWLHAVDILAKLTGWLYDKPVP